jgi:hypothetical protein
MIGTRLLAVNRRAAALFGITNDAGQSGLVLPVNAPFDVRVTNTPTDPAVIH